jgi:hypothetical protein
MSHMNQTLVTQTAREQILALDEDGQDAVDEAVGDLSAERDERVVLPGTPQGTTYFARLTRGEDPHAVIYKTEPGVVTILALMTLEEYEDVRQLQEALTNPDVQMLIEAAAKALRPGSRGIPVLRVGTAPKQVSRDDEKAPEDTGRASADARKDWNPEQLEREEDEAAGEPGGNTD